MMVLYLALLSVAALTTVAICISWVVFDTARVAFVEPSAQRHREGNPWGGAAPLGPASDTPLRDLLDLVVGCPPEVERQVSPELRRILCPLLAHGDDPIDARTWAVALHELARVLLDAPLSIEPDQVRAHLQHWRQLTDSQQLQVDVRVPAPGDSFDPVLHRPDNLAAGLDLDLVVARPLGATVRFEDSTQTRYFKAAVRTRAASPES